MKEGNDEYYKATENFMEVVIAIVRMKKGLLDKIKDNPDRVRFLAEHTCKLLDTEIDKLRWKLRELTYLEYFRRNSNESGK